MKYSILIAAGVGLVAAQNLTGQPECAIPCLQNAISQVCVPASDRACSCTSQDAIAGLAVSCLLANCDSEELGQAQLAGAQLCIDYSATAAPVPSTAASTTASTTVTDTGVVILPTATTAVPTDVTATSNGTSTATTGSGEASTVTPSTTRSSSSGRTSATASSSASATATSTAGADAVTAGFAAQAGMMGVFLAGVAALL